VPTVTVVAPTYRRRDRLKGWTAAVLADPAVDELVVVVDGADDGSIELLESLARDDDRLRPFKIPNAGQFGAMHAGAERATGDVLLFLDDDVLPGQGLVAGHGRHHADASEGGLVVLGYMPVALPSPRRPGQVATFLYDDVYEHQCRRYEEDPSTVLGNFWAGNFSMRRTDALRVGLAGSGGPQYPYHPDREFGLRCAAAGLEGRFDRTLVATHRHERSLDAFLGEARARATGAWHLHERHRDSLGPWRADRYEEHVPAPTRPLVRAARVPGVAALATPVLKAAVQVSGAIRWFRAESALATVAMHVLEVDTGSRLRRQAEAAPSVPDRVTARALATGPLLRLDERRVGAVDGAEVVRVVDALEAAGVGAWIAGGWGVDALVGQQTRAHRDLDLAVDDRDAAVAAVAALGYALVDEYVQEGAGLPHRVILRRGTGGDVDLHPIAGPDEVATAAAITTDPFAAGRIRGRTVRCLSASVQLAFHRGYESRRVDRLDVSRLRRMTAEPDRTGR
jgi:GT2 family glycosyltransferase